jgi:uncharacterized protein (DUF2342 family)
MDQPSLDPAQLTSAASGYRTLAAKLETPLLNFVGPLPRGAAMPRFEAIDREGWIDLNLEILRRVVDPVLEAGRMPNSLIVEVGKAGVDRYVGYMLAFLGSRVLGQYDPQLMGAEPVGGDGLYLVETNVVAWQNQANLPDEDLRRWLILHEMTHAWQFAAHPWLRKYMEESMQELIDSVTRKGSRCDATRRLRGSAPGAVARDAQGAGRDVGGRGLQQPGHEPARTQTAARLRPPRGRLPRAQLGKSALEVLIWKLTGLDLKLQQYKRGEAFCQAVYDQYGMQILNRVWDGPEYMPNLKELGESEHLVPPDVRGSVSASGESAQNLIPELLLGRLLADRHDRDRQVAYVEVAHRLAQPLGDADLNLHAQREAAEDPHLV